MYGFSHLGFLGGVSRTDIENAAYEAFVRRFIVATGRNIAVDGRAVAQAYAKLYNMGASWPESYVLPDDVAIDSQFIIVAHGFSPGSQERSETVFDTFGTLIQPIPPAPQIPQAPSSTPIYSASSLLPNWSPLPPGSSIVTPPTFSPPSTPLSVAQQTSGTLASLTTPGPGKVPVPFNPFTLSPIVDTFFGFLNQADKNTVAAKLAAQGKGYVPQQAAQQMGLTTGEKVGIGIGAIAVLGTIGLLIYRSAKGK